jgi:hypothetical protein
LGLGQRRESEQQTSHVCSTARLERNAVEIAETKKTCRPKNVCRPLGVLVETCLPRPADEDERSVFGSERAVRTYYSVAAF